MIYIQTYFYFFIHIHTFFFLAKRKDFKIQLLGIIDHGDQIILGVIYNLELFVDNMKY